MKTEAEYKVEIITAVERHLRNVAGGPHLGELARSLVEADGILAEGDRSRRYADVLRALHHECPACGHRGRCDVSEHAYFAKDASGLRCRRCRHVWKHPYGDGPPMPKCTGCGNPAADLSAHWFFREDFAVARCPACRLIGVVGSDEPWVSYLAGPSAGRREGVDDALKAMGARVVERERASLLRPLEGGGGAGRVHFREFT